MRKLFTLLFLFIALVARCQSVSQVPQGGTGRNNLNNHRILLGNTTSPIVSLASGTLGLPLISQAAGSDPIWAALTTAGGGTGLTSSGAAGNYLRSDGSIWASSAIQAADVPVLNQNTTGSAGTLNPGRNINGVLFNGSANITITAAAGTLTGSTLASNVLSSSLTSVGTLANLTVTNPISGSVTGNAGTVTSGVYTTGSYSDPAWLTSLAGSKITGNISGNSANVTGTVAIANGGTGQVTANAAFNALAPSQGSQSGKFLTTNGTSTSWSAVTSGVSSVSNSDGTITASPTTGAVVLSLPTVGITHGGTGATTANTALNALLPSQATFAGKVLGTDGTNTSWVTGGGSSGWGLLGNAGTTSSNFLGTTDAQSLRFKVNGELAGLLSADNDEGMSLGIGAMPNVQAADSHNIALGYDALADCITGYWNTVLGFEAGQKVTVAWGNTIMGWEAGDSLLNGYANTFLGSSAGRDARGAWGNTLIGDSTGVAITEGFGNVSVGPYALMSIDSSWENIGIGILALWSAKGFNCYQNVAIGPRALAAATGTGALNIAIGNDAMPNLTDGQNNVAIGAYSGQGVIDGTGNLFIGSEANSSGDGNFNTIIGINGLGTGVSNSVALGANANVTTSNTVRLGDASVTDVVTDGSYTGLGATLTGLDDHSVLITSTNGFVVDVPPTTDGFVFTLAGGVPVWAAASGGFTNPMTVLGDMMYENATPAAARLAGNTTSTNKFLSQTGTGSVSAAPIWAALVSGDIPNNAANTTGSAAKWTTARNLAGNSVDGSANVAFANKFIVQGTADAGLSNAQFLGALGTGLLKNTTTTGVLSIAGSSDLPTITLTGDVTGAASGGSIGTTIASNAVTTSKINNASVTLAKIANAGTNSVLVGSGASGSGAAYSEITLGGGLSMSGTVLSSSTSSGANPTASAGLSAVNGSASTFMRSDAAPALDQSIAPTWTGLHTFNITNATTNAVDNILTVDHNSSGTVAANFGSGLAFNLQSTTTANRNAGLLKVFWSTATDASRVGKMVWQLANNTALADVLTITGAGNGTFAGTLGASNLSGTNTGDVSLAGENYLSIAGQTITAAAINLSGTNATGTMAAGRFPALTGNVTTSAGSLVTTIANLAVTNAMIAAGTIDLTAKVTGVLPVANGGTGQSTYTDGQLLIGNTTGNTLAKATITGTANQITITNGHGTITASFPTDVVIAGDITAGSGYPSNGGRIHLDNAYGNNTITNLTADLPVNDVNYASNTWFGDAVGNAVNAPTGSTTLIGAYSGRNTLDGQHDAFLGVLTGAGWTHIGNDNVACGDYALDTTGGSSGSITLGNQNVAIGSQAGYQISASNADNIFIGYTAGKGTNGSTAMYLGEAARSWKYGNTDTTAWRSLVIKPSTGEVRIVGIANYGISTLPVANGGTGLTTLTNHALQVGAGTSNVTQIAVPASGTVLTGVTNSDPAFSATPTLGVAGTTTGQLLFANATGSNVITLASPASPSAYTFTLPVDGGTNNYVLKTNGSGTTAWVAQSGGMSNPMTATGDLIYSSDGSGTPARLAIGASTTVLHGGTTPSYSAVANADLTNSSITIQGSAVSLGGSTLSTTATPQFATIGLGVAADATVPLLTAQTSATTNALVSNLQYSLSSSGTVAANFGMQNTYRLDDNTTANQNAGREIWEWTTATHASHASRYRMQLSAGGAAVSDAMTITNIAATFPGTLAIGGGFSGATSGTFSAAITETNNGIAATSTDGIIIANTTSATSGAQQQYSPRIRIKGAGWKTNSVAASQLAEWIIEDQPQSGAAVITENLVFSSQVNSAGYTARATLNDAGNLNLNTAAAAMQINGTSLLANPQGIGVTSTDGLVLTNGTAAANNAQQWSPRIRLTGQGWKTNATAASQVDDWIIENQTVQGAAATTANLVFSSQIAAGGYTAQMTLSSGGVITGPTWNGAKVSEAYGGTNQSTYAAGDMLYCQTSNALAKLTGPAQEGALLIGSNAGTAMPIWQNANAKSGNTLNPTGTSSASGKMMGLANTSNTYILTTSNNSAGKVLVVITGNLNSGATGNPTVQLAYGTGTAPTNGDAVTGTTAGTLCKVAGIATGTFPFTCMAMVTGLSDGTNYWFDLQLISDGTSTASVTSVAGAFYNIP